MEPYNRKIGSAASKIAYQDKFLLMPCHAFFKGQTRCNRLKLKDDVFKTGQFGGPSQPALGNQIYFPVLGENNRTAHHHIRNFPADAGLSFFLQPSQYNRDEVL